MPKEKPATSTATAAAPMDVKATDVTGGLTRQLFGKQVTPDRPAPTLEYQALEDGGVIVKHEGIKVIEYKKDGRDRKTKLHMFSSKAGQGNWFSVFGNANLDSQIRKLSRPGVIFLLRYAGKQKLEGSDREQHMWEVAETSARLEQINQLRERDEWRTRELALDAAITAADRAELERRTSRDTSGEPAPPPHEDDDLPF